MYKNLRIVFTILSAICIAAAIPLGTAFDFVGWIGALIGAGIFFFLMLLCKQSQEDAEAKRQKALPSLSEQAAEDGTNETQDSEDTEDGKTNSTQRPSAATKKNNGDETKNPAPYKYKRKKK